MITAYDKAQLPFQVTELMASETCRMNISDFKQKQSILPNGSIAKC